MSSVPVIAETQAATDSNGGSTDSLTITFGTAPSAGQYILLLAVSGTSGGNTLTTPSGFTKLYGDGSSYGIFAKVATGSEGASFTISDFDEAGLLYGIRITGVTSTPLDQSAQNTSSANSPSVTTTVNNDLILSIYVSTSSNSVPTVPTGYTSVQDGGVSSAHGGPIRLTVASSSLGTAGVTGTAAWSRSANYVTSLAISPPASTSTIFRREFSSRTGSRGRSA
jgi:hypothetical protein